MDVLLRCVLWLDGCFQTCNEREIQQQMLIQDEETLELRETFTSLQQEVEAKTKKLKKVKRCSDAQSSKKNIVITDRPTDTFTHAGTCFSFMYRHKHLFSVPNVSISLFTLLTPDLDPYDPPASDTRPVNLSA